MTASTTTRPVGLPHVGDIWVWEPLKPYAFELVKVTDVTWSGEEWFVESVGWARPDSERCWNGLSRWVEATVLVKPRED